MRARALFAEIGMPHMVKKVQDWIARLDLGRNPEGEDETP